MPAPQSRLIAGYQQAVATATRDDKQRLGLIAKLMISGYYVPEMTVAEFKLQASDWRADLSPYPPEVVSQACNDYRQNAVNTQRPLPAQIASLCSQIMFRRLERLKQKSLPALEDRRTARFAFTPEELDERQEYAAIAGYADWQVFLDAVHEGHESVMPFLAWSRANREARGSLPEPVQGFKTLG